MRIWFAYLGLIASCGGSDSREGTNSDTEISKADFVERANARCTSLSETLSNAQADIGSAPTEEQIEDFMTDVLVAEYRETLDDIEADPIESLASPESPFVEVNVAFQDYGLTVCAET